MMMTSLSHKANSLSRGITKACTKDMDVDWIWRTRTSENPHLTLSPSSNRVHEKFSPTTVPNTLMTMTMTALTPMARMMTKRWTISQ